MKRRKPVMRSAAYENPPEAFDYDAYLELTEDGYDDRDIARELNISEGFLKSIKRQELDDY